MTLGQYDELSLKEARELVAEYRKLVSVGRDPITVRDMQIETNIQAATVEDCINAWLVSASASRLVKRDHWDRALKRHVSSYVGNMIVDDMAISHWQPVFKRMRENGAETFSGEVLSRMKTIFSYCIRTEMIKRNPVADLRIIDVGKPAKSGKRNFSDGEINAFWKAVEASTITYQNQLFLKLLLLTGCRGVELRLAKKSEFDLKGRVWRVPDIGSFGGAAAIGIGAVIAAMALSSSIAGKRKNGGPVSAGSMYQVGEGGMPEIYQASSGKQFMIPGDNGKVISNKDMQSGSGGGGGVVVNINNYTSSTVDAQATPDGKGGWTVDAFVYDISNGGPASQAIEQYHQAPRKARE